MKKSLLMKTMLLLWALIVGSSSVWAAEADFTYDFTESGWSVNSGTLSNGTVSFTGTGGANFKMNSGYFMMGKNGAYINFPTYSRPVAKIVVTGRSGASGSVEQNIYVDGTAVSTATTGATGANTYEIASAYQAAGNQYTLKVTSNHNTQITKIEVFFVDDKKVCDLALTDATIALSFDLYNNSSAQVINYTTSSTGVVTIDDNDYAEFDIDKENKTITVTPLKKTNGEEEITVSQAADDDYNAGSVTFKMTITDSTPKTGSWVLTDFANLAEGDVFVIVGENADGTYAMSNSNGTGSAPTAVAVTIVNEEINDDDDIPDNIKWNISGNATDGYTFYPNGTTETWLYCNTTASSSSNNNMRVGTGERKVFALSGDNLVTKDNYTARYVSIYNNTDWRGYVNTNSAPSIAFYKYEDSSKADPELSFDVDEVNANISDAFVAPTLNTATGFNGTVEYSSSDETVAQIMDSETGDLMLLKEGTTIITATFAGNDDFKFGSARYTLTVTDNRIATTITQENIVLEVSEVASLTQLNPVVKDANDNVIPYEFSEFLSIVSFDQLSEDDVIASIDGNTGQILLSGNVGTATLKAYYNRYNENTTYKPSECTFTITVERTQTISEARAQGTGSVTTKGIVTSCSGTTAYIQDANAAICVYGSELTIGDEVKVKGTLYDYNGLLEITDPEVTVLSQNNTITPEVMTIAEINASEKQGWLVKIEDAKVTAISGQNTTIAQGENTIVVRGIIGIDIAVNDVITLTGNIGCYNATQIANPTDVAVTGVTITLVEACHNSENIYYGTYSNANAFIVPDDLTVAEVGIDSENKLIVETYKTGDIVPANTGVVVSSATAGAHVVLFSTGGTSVMSNSNCLRATGNEGITAAAMDEADLDCVFYRLTMHNKTDLGFYWGAEEGAAFAVAANKAYLAVPKTAGARIQGFSLDGDTVTGISQIENEKSEVENYFDLQGRSIANPAKGLYIKNGKKVVIR